MDTYDRVVLRRGGSVILRNLRRRDFFGLPTVTGIIVNREGQNVETSDGKRADVVIGAYSATGDVKRVIPLRINLKYGELEPTTDDARLPYYPGR